MPLILPNTIANLIPADGDKLGQNFATIEDWANQDAITSDGSTAMVAPLLLPGPPTQTNQAATKGYVDSAVPVGVIWMTAADTAADGWMMCRGQAISRASYAALFNSIGTRFGSGDGSTTFNLPDYQGTYPVGHNAVLGGLFNGPVGERAGQADSVLPIHGHMAQPHLHTVNITSGGQSAVHTHTIPGIAGTGSGLNGDGFGLVRDGQGAMATTGQVGTDHSHNVSGYTGMSGEWATSNAGTDPHNGNLPPSMALNFIIRVS